MIAEVIREIDTRKQQEDRRACEILLNVMRQEDKFDEKAGRILMPILSGLFLLALIFFIGWLFGAWPCR